MVVILRSLHIVRYEQFADVPEIRFSDAENVIIGANGAGKTPRFGVNGELRARHPAMKFQCEMQIKSEGQEARVSFDGEKTAFTVHDEVIHSARPESPYAPFNVFFVWAKNRLNSSRQFFANVLFHLSSSGRARRITESDEEFRVLEGGGGVEDGASVIRKDFLSLKPWWLASILGPLGMAADISEGIRYPQEPPLSQDPANHTDALHYALGFILEKFNATRITFKLKPVRRGPAAMDFEAEGVDVAIKFNSGLELAGSQLTFGQRRFIACLLVNAVPDRLVKYPAIIDEIDNGLHPELLEALMVYFHGRQSIFSTHNTLALDYVSFNSQEDIRLKIHQCVREADGRQIVNAYDEQTAQEVYEKVEVGLLSPSQVLLSGGLW